MYTDLITVFARILVYIGTRICYNIHMNSSEPLETMADERWRAEYVRELRARAGGRGMPQRPCGARHLTAQRRVFQ
jgi:hypothetical protein